MDLNQRESPIPRSLAQYCLGCAGRSRYMKYILPLILLISSCVYQSSYKGITGDWTKMGYEGFSSKINAMSGHNSLDCGFYNLIESIPSLVDVTIEQGFQCAREASKQGVPFKFGTKRIPTDSYAFEVLYSTPEKEYWLVTLDVMLTNGEMQQWNKKCKNVLFKGKSYEGVECEEVHYRDWIQL